MVAVVISVWVFHAVGSLGNEMTGDTVKVCVRVCA